MNSSYSGDNDTVVFEFVDLELDDARLDSNSTFLNDSNIGLDSFHPFLFLALMIIGQLLIYLWYKKSYKSYQIVTACLIYLFTAFICFSGQLVLYTINWLLFTVILVVFIFKVTQNPIRDTTPKFIYTVLHYIFKLASIIGAITVIVYVAIFLALISVTSSLVTSKLIQVMDMLVNVILNIGIFGILYQDMAALLSDMIVVRIKNKFEHQLPEQNSDLCSICGRHLYGLTKPTEFNDDNDTEIDCHHKFHEFCIRGWCIIGKKDTCPTCHEKCNLRNRYIQPWEKSQLYMGDIIYFIRLIFVWNPILIAIYFFLDIYMIWHK